MAWTNRLCRVCDKVAQNRAILINPAPELPITSRFRRAAAQARRRQIGWLITLKQYKEILTIGKCHYCSGPLPRTGGGLDRKDSSIGYVVDNVVPCCKGCNTEKSTRNYERYAKKRGVIPPKDL